MADHKESHVFEPKTRVIITKEQAQGISVGQDVKITIGGSVSGISETFEDKNKFDLEIKKTQVSGIKSNLADKAVKEMSKKR